MQCNVMYVCKAISFSFSMDRTLSDPSMTTFFDAKIVNFHKSVLSTAHACEGCLGGVGCIRFQKYVVLGFRMAHFRLLMY